MMHKRGMLLIVFLLAFPIVSAQETYHLKLLAVQENGTNYIGSEADLFLELIEGSGRVFLETKPLTKMDTQISTRFAKEIACKHFKLDCNKYDFIYTIRSASNIIGGPSAGAAISALTTIAVLDLKYDEEVTITGTINSGGIVGHVGGVKEKLEAASKSKIKKVLVAKGTTQTEFLNGSNKTNLDLGSYAQDNLSLELIEVMDLDEVVFHLTGKDLNHQVFNLTENKQYTEIMQGLRNILCGRTEKIEQEIYQEGIKLDVNISKLLEEKKSSAINATTNKDYYSAASFCFGNNILLRSEYYQQKEPSEKMVENLFLILQKKTNLLKNSLEQEDISTISDLQTLMVVKERINDVEKSIARINETEDQYNLLAYAEERYFSALSWKQFFAMEGKKFLLSEGVLRESCQLKISEAEERHQYASLFLGLLPVMNIQEKINAAEKSLVNDEFELCLILSSQAKADANAILSSLGLNEDNVAEFLESKKKAAERVIFENSAEGIFPILGYSYYQYANSLQEQEPYTALVYLEYALEMSELSIYFPEESEFFEVGFRIEEKWWYLGIGILLGLLVSGLVLFLRKK